MHLRFESDKIMTDQQDLPSIPRTTAPRPRTMRFFALAVLAALSITAVIGVSAVAAAALPSSAASAATQADLPATPPDGLARDASRSTNIVSAVPASNSPVGAWLYPAVAAVVIPLLSVVLLLLLAVRRRRRGFFGDPTITRPSGMEPLLFA